METGSNTSDQTITCQPCADRVRPMLGREYDSAAELAEYASRPTAVQASDAFGLTILAAAAGKGGNIAQHGWITYLELAAIREATRDRATRPAATITASEAASIASGYLPPSAVPKVSERMRRYHGASRG